jgi:hypothetical protein
MQLHEIKSLLGEIYEIMVFSYYASGFTEQS